MLENTIENKLEPATETPAADKITVYAAQLSIVEAAVGTVIHAAHVPFGGHLLSLNEGAFLARATNDSTSRSSAAIACYEIAGVSAAFKSLAPAAKKLGPMLSIMMQGLLFTVGILVAGRGRLGQILGMALLSTWAFVQPFITLVISFGPSEITRVLHFYNEKIHAEYSADAAIRVIATLFALKCLIGAIVVFILPRITDARWLNLQKKMVARAEKIAPIRCSAQTGSAWRGALRDLRQPLFLISFALTIVFLFVQKESMSTIVWMSLRPLAIAFIIFYLLRAPWFVNLCGRLGESLGIFRPIHARLVRVREYLNS
jgi:hypothetical protein